jgi:hypothetical protein
MKGWLIGVGRIAAVNACVATNAFAAIILMWTLWNMQHEEALASAEPGANWKDSGSAVSMRGIPLTDARPTRAPVLASRHLIA